MDENYPNINPEEQKLFKGLEPPFEKSREDLWARMEARMDAAPAAPAPAPPRGRLIAMPWFRVGVAAAVAILVTFTLFARFYTRSLDCDRGERLSHVLPDGSRVLLNAESELSYRPLWWIFNREVNFSGEGFFEVEKGRKFTVRSPQGTTRVLGTSFNILAREGLYQVFCATGRVSVVPGGSDEEIILTPQMSATVTRKIEVREAADPGAILSWKEGRFHFDSLVLPDVFAEVERQYDITLEIEPGAISGLKYSGSFKKPDQPTKILHLICNSFDLNFKQLNDSSFKISRK